MVVVAGGEALPAVSLAMTSMVFRPHTINAADKTRAEADFLYVAIQVNVVANILLRSSHRWMGPPQLDSGRRNRTLAR